MGFEERGEERKEFKRQYRMNEERAARLRANSFRAEELRLAPKGGRLVLLVLATKPRNAEAPRERRLFLCSTKRQASSTTRRPAALAFGGGLVVGDFLLEPEGFGVDGDGGIGDGRNFFGAAENVDDVDGFGDVFEARIGFLAEDFGFVGIDGNDVVTGGLEVGGDFVGGRGEDWRRGRRRRWFWSGGGDR